jgi:PhnB protein
VITFYLCREPPGGSGRPDQAGKKEDHMQSKLNPYLNFRDQARAAMEFYATVFGGKLQISTFKEYHASQDPSEDNKTMHAVLETDNGITLMASDTPSSMEFHPGNTMSVSLSGDDEKELRGYWEGLAAGATIQMPLAKAGWGDTFGMLTDKFGVPWLVNIAAKKA